MSTRVVPKVVWGNAVARLRRGLVSTAAACMVLFGAAAQAQTPATPAGQPPAPEAAPTGVTPPAGYLVGPEDVLTVVFWRDKELSGEVVVRPDGKISLPLLNDVPAAGYTPEQLRGVIGKAASKYIDDPTATVMVKAINSRKVHIIGNVGKPGTYPLVSDMTVLQFIALAGGLQEYAEAKDIKVMRKEGGTDLALKFNYKEVVKGKNLQQNVALKPGDTVIVP